MMVDVLMRWVNGYTRGAQNYSMGVPVFAMISSRLSRFVSVWAALLGERRWGMWGWIVRMAALGKVRNLRQGKRRLVGTTLL